ncbi:nucleoside deaminase [Parvularcula dongshanensis]|uniref:tRNA-specific adenosine deaminase n=1 Tax=Parvularcula dongshanensis TaxID=1173995 RepID=A0A840I117_9PROT|nr:nucleoside deaminase [Parvularcula dongshanensis]MBB4657790.1 tRNA(Arg) A34 adenosine deaminase TadA [Parvularcula dongshanensis]
MDDTIFMTRALQAARAAEAAGEVPVGAVLVDERGVILAEASNRTLRDRDPTAHAEVVALRQGAKRRGHRLTGCTLYVTLEPCAMCAGAISHARIGRLVYAALDPKGGAVEHGPKLFGQPTIHARPLVERGPGGEAAGEMLRTFFRARR